MTHRPIRTEADGTRVYADGKRYRPLSDDERQRRRRKPDDPRAVRFHKHWFVPFDVQPDEARVMPETVPDDETLLHSATCRCLVCVRPQASDVWRRAARRSARR